MISWPFSHSHREGGEKPLILFYNNFFAEPPPIPSSPCIEGCEFTTDRRALSKAAAVVFHIPNRRPRMPLFKRRGQLCESQAKITTLDTRHARALGLFTGTRLTWGEAKRRIVKRVPPGALASLCAGCQWLELGLCERALSDLHAEAAD